MRMFALILGITDLNKGLLSSAFVAELLSVNVDETVLDIRTVKRGELSGTQTRFHCEQGHKRPRIQWSFLRILF